MRNKAAKDPRDGGGGEVRQKFVGGSAPKREVNFQGVLVVQGVQTHHLAHFCGRPYISCRVAALQGSAAFFHKREKRINDIEKANCHSEFGPRNVHWEILSCGLPIYNLRTKLLATQNILLWLPNHELNEHWWDSTGYSQCLCDYFFFFYIFIAQLYFRYDSKHKHHKESLMLQRSATISRNTKWTKIPISNIVVCYKQLNDVIVCCKQFNDVTACCKQFNDVTICYKHVNDVTICCKRFSRLNISTWHSSNLLNLVLFYP